MSGSAKTALGAILKIAPSGSAVASLGEVLQLNPPKITRGVIEASDLATTGGMDYIQQELYDGGEISGQVHWILSDSNDDVLLPGILTGGKYDFELHAKASTGFYKISGSCFFTEYGGDTLEISGKQTASFTLKITGDVAQAVVA